MRSALPLSSASATFDLDRASALVLSYGHYDPTGGVPAFLASNPHAHHGYRATRQDAARDSQTLKRLAFGRHAAGVVHSAAQSSP